MKDGPRSMIMELLQKKFDEIFENLFEFQLHLNT